jgi:hypothetical protein
MEAYFKGHYSHKTLSESIRSNTVDQLIKNLDASKTLFLDEDVQLLRKTLPTLFSGIQKGDCRALEDAYSLMIRRAKENEDYVRSFLGKSYALDETVEVSLDPEKRKFPKNRPYCGDSFIFRSVIISCRA